MTKTKLIFCLLLSIFCLPVFFSWMVYFCYDYLHLKTNNYGLLLIPPVQIAEFFGNYSYEPKKWQIVYAPSDCYTNQSQKMLFILHQLRQALGANDKRVNLTLWLQTPCQLDKANEFYKIKLSSQQIKRMQKRFDFAMNRIYLIDPLNNMFMQYSAETNPMNIFKDIKKVLEVSQIG